MFTNFPKSAPRGWEEVGAGGSSTKIDDAQIEGEIERGSWVVP